MFFTRQRHDGNHEFASQHPLTPTPTIFAARKTSYSGFLALFAALSSISILSPLQAKEKIIGVQGWTNGSATYLRARPGANTPPVAKVARHTPIYVWGKFQGWYRVETSDHVFGWVYFDYISSPDLAKVRELSSWKARDASNRTASQTMYGSPEVLKKMVARYGAPGAVKGLAKQGIRVAQTPETAAKPVQIAKAPAIKASSSKIAPRKTLMARLPFEKPVVAAKAIERESVLRETEVRPVIRQSAMAPSMILAPRLPLSSETAPVSKIPETKPVARAVKPAPVTERFARTPNSETPAPIEMAPLEAAPSPIVAPAPIPAPVLAKAPQKTVAKAVAKPVSKAPAQKRISWREKKRQQAREKLRQRLSASPTKAPSYRGGSPRDLVAPTIAPISPAELLKAREEFLAARRARQNAPATPESLTPLGSVAPLPDGAGFGASALAPAPPAFVTPSSWSGKKTPFSTSPIQKTAPAFYSLDMPLGGPVVVAQSQLKPTAPAPSIPKIASTPKIVTPKPTTLASRGPSFKNAPIRGGSPRDLMMARLETQKAPQNPFGSQMATQALSYRGMPYIRGAASPSRGFDCSGLVYFLLRQRGFNPPRTAAGYRGWGQNVARQDLKAGDLLLFANTYKRGISHIGVYTGNGNFVHAATSGTGVRSSSLSEAYYAHKYYGARRAK